MKSEIITIQGRLVGLNELIHETNKHHKAGNALKQEMTTICEMYFRRYCKKKYKKIHVIFHWIEPNKKRDKDNIASAKKYIFDGMQQAGVIENDGWENVESFEDKFSVDKDNARIEVTIKEV